MYHYVACSACFSSSIIWREGFLVFYNALISAHYKRDLCKYFLHRIRFMVGFCMHKEERFYALMTVTVPKIVIYQTSITRSFHKIWRV